HRDWRSGGPGAAGRPGPSRSRLSLDPHPEVASLAGGDVHPSIGVDGVVAAVERLQADEVTAGLRPELQVPHRGREAQAQAAEAGEVEAGAAVRGRLQAEVELASVRELLGGPEAGHVARHLRLARRRAAEVRV